jgi:hypothetical protein
MLCWQKDLLTHREPQWRSIYFDTTVRSGLSAEVLFGLLCQRTATSFSRHEDKPLNRATPFRLAFLSASAYRALETRPWEFQKNDLENLSDSSGIIGSNKGNGRNGADEVPDHIIPYSLELTPFQSMMFTSFQGFLRSSN